MQSDLSTTTAAEQLVASAVSAFGRLDILIANHGIWPPEDAPVDRLTDDQWHRTIAINVDSVFGLVKHSVAQMKKQRSSETQGDQPASHIVLVSSTAGQRGEAFHCDYAASKGAIISMVKGLSTELARDNIRVNCVAPGWVATDMSAAALNDPPTRAKVFATIPLGRVATPEEIAELQASEIFRGDAIEAQLHFAVLVLHLGREPVPGAIRGKGPGLRHRAQVSAHVGAGRHARHRQGG